MQKPHERTLQMMENFVKLHEDGRSIAEIAKEYNLSESTVYNRLGEIAERAGVSRESLLEKPFLADHSGRNYTPVEPIDTTELEKLFDEVMIYLRKAREEMESIISEQEELSAILAIEEE